jgi:hypothetical protein
MASTTAFKGYKIFTTLKVNIEDIILDSINYLTNRFNQNKSVFTAASPFGQLLIVVENLSQLIFYYIEDAVTELNINEATRLTSIYSLATLAGHNPSRAMSAVGKISLSVNEEGEEFPADVVIIPNLTRLTNLNNGLTYVLDLSQDQIKFSLNGNDNGLELGIRQGIVETQTVIAKGVALDSFSIGSSQNFFIDQYFLNVYVNGEKWRKYDSILDIPNGADGYIAKTGITSGLDIFFGNDTYGKILAPGTEIIVEYLINEGPRGNIRTEDTDQVKFTFVDTGFTVLGEEVELNDFITITTTTAPFFGVNPESAELTRLIAPKTSKSFALVNPDHYEIVLRKLNMFSLINVYLDDEDNRILNIFLVPDIRKTFSVAQNYFGADLNKFKMNDYQKSELLKYIEKAGSKLISTDIKLIDPVITNYVINLSIITFDDVPPEIIKNDIYDSIGKYFIVNTRRNRIPKSDLIKLIEEVNGVDSVSIKILGENNETSKKSNPDAALVGLDEYNDIIISGNQLPVIRGGWSDRNGNEYVLGISEEELGAVNISITDIVKRPK